jgi:hypothetical protein
LLRLARSGAGILNDKTADGERNAYASDAHAEIS